jgi:hypothetical protein
MWSLWQTEREQNATRAHAQEALGLARKAQGCMKRRAGGEESVYLQASGRRGVRLPAGKRAERSLFICRRTGGGESCLSAGERAGTSLSICRRAGGGAACCTEWQGSMWAVFCRSCHLAPFCHFNHAVHGTSSEDGQFCSISPFHPCRATFCRATSCLTHLEAKPPGMPHRLPCKLWAIQAVTLSSECIRG